MYSKSKFRLIDILNVGIFTAIMIAIGIVAGYVFGQAFGPGMALFNGILIPIILSMGVRRIWKFPCATIMLFVYATVMIPFPIWGPPGFHKPFQGLLAGLIYDFLLFVIAKRHINKGIVISSAIMDAAGVFMMYIALLLYPEFKADTFRQYAPFMIFLGLPFGALAGYIANRIVKKIGEP